MKAHFTAATHVEVHIPLTCNINMKTSSAAAAAAAAAEPAEPAVAAAAESLASQDPKMIGC